MIRTCCAPLVISMLIAGTIARAADPAETCRTNKMQRAGTYNLCLLKATARAIRHAEPPDTTKCDAKFAAVWAKDEARSGGACPTSGDAGPIATQVQGDVAAIVAALTPTTTTLPPTLCGGGIWPGCGGSCPSGQSCWADIVPGPSQICACHPAVSTPCAATGGPTIGASTCGGECPAGEVCTTLHIADDTLAATCGCVTAGTTPCISSSEPTCGGSCPSGSACAPDILFSCGCQ